MDLIRAQAMSEFGLQLFWIIAALTVTLAHFAMEPWRWISCYLPRDTSRLVRGRVRDALFCTALATYVFPFKLGIPLRLLLLQRSSRTSLHFLTLVIAFDGSLSLVAWLSLAVFCAWLAALGWQIPWYVSTGAILFMGIAVLGVLLLRRARSVWLHKLSEAIALLDYPWRRGACSLLILLLDVASYGLRHAIILFMVTDDGRILFLGGAAGIIATFAGIISGLPMGLVGYDASLVALLALAGVSAEAALAVALVNRALNLTSSVLLGIPAAMRLGLGSSIAAILKRLQEIANERR